MESVRGTFSSLSSGAKKKWNSLIGEEPDEQDQSLLDQFKAEADDFCGQFKLTKKQRIYGFLICFLGGLAISLLGVGLLYIGSITSFAICYSFGSIMSLISSAFLFGPMYQLKNMFKLHRLAATCLVLLFIILTLVAALVWKSSLLAIIFCFCQFCAWFWYCLSYIPFARALAEKCIMGCCV
eukprot:m.56282 g.56282  ORF g.56282 m.56282 type:complete len:182 (-) comp18729_c0_seq2:162-707(-)